MGRGGEDETQVTESLDCLSLNHETKVHMIPCPDQWSGTTFAILFSILICPLYLPS